MEKGLGILNKLQRERLVDGVEGDFYFLTMAFLNVLIYVV